MAAPQSSGAALCSGHDGLRPPVTIEGIQKIAGAQIQLVPIKPEIRLQRQGFTGKGEQDVITGARRAMRHAGQQMRVTLGKTGMKCDEIGDDRQATADVARTDRGFSGPDGHSRQFAEHQRPVGAAEAEGVGDGDIDFHLACRIRHVIQIAFRVGGDEIDRRRRDLVLYRQRR